MLSTHFFISIEIVKNVFNMYGSSNVILCILYSFWQWLSERVISWLHGHMHVWLVMVILMCTYSDWIIGVTGTWIESLVWKIGATCLYDPNYQYLAFILLDRCS